MRIDAKKPLAILIGALDVIASAAAAMLTKLGSRTDNIALYQEGIGLAPDGSLVIIPAGEDLAYLAGSRVLDPGPDAAPADREAAERLADESRAWLANGTVPGKGGPYEHLAEDALLDLYTLTKASGGVVAGAMPRWSYVWPRDAAFVAVAMATTWHYDDARDAFTFLQSVQAPDGTFHARYTVREQLPPDGRGHQTDGTGWSLWALHCVISNLPETAAGRAQRDEFLTQFTPLLNRSSAFLQSQVTAADPLPAPSADYWEHRESRVTLGTAAPVLAGLEAAAALHKMSGEHHRSTRAAECATMLRAAIGDSFGRSGYGRYPGRIAPDAATAFILPPFVSEPLPGAKRAWRASIKTMTRPGGGLAPGATWPESTNSWTPQTSLYAWTAATLGDTATAHRYLSWVRSHRTSTGAIPEKVGPQGQPAAVAPLAWSCALAVLTISALDAPS